MQLKHQPKYDRYARRRIDDELIALRRRIPSLTVKVLANAVSELADLKHRIPEEYFYRLSTIKDEKWIDYIVDWIERLHNPNIRQELGIDYPLHRFALAHIEWQNGIVSLSDWDRFKDANRGWALIEGSGSPGSILLTPEVRPYFLVLYISPPMNPQSARHLWMGVAIPVQRGNLRFFLRCDALGAVLEFNLTGFAQTEERDAGVLLSQNAAEQLLGRTSVPIRGLSRVYWFRPMTPAERTKFMEMNSKIVMGNQLANLIYLREANQ